MDNVKVFEILNSYKNSLDSKANTIKLIRESKKSLEDIFPMPDIQKCANEMEAELSRRTIFLATYIRKFKESGILEKEDEELLDKMYKEIYPYKNPRSNLEVKYDFKP